MLTHPYRLRKVQSEKAVRLRPLLGQCQCSYVAHTAFLLYILASILFMDGLNMLLQELKGY